MDGNMKDNDTKLLEEAYMTSKEKFEPYENEEVIAFLNNPDMEIDDLSDKILEKLFAYYMDSGEMPYGVMKARTGDPYDWMARQLVMNYKWKK